MGNRQTQKTTGGRILAPAWLRVDDRQPGYAPTLQPSCREICQSWLHYHTIQLRWDVERRLARLFGKRWGG